MVLLAGATVACVSLATILVGVRMYTGGFVTRSLGFDDLLLVASLLGAITHEVGTMILSSGLGNPSAPKTTLAKWLFATILASQVTHGLLNLSVVLQYRRIFTSPFAGRVSLVLSVWLAFWAVSSVALAPFMCTPPREFWADLGNRDGCVSRAEIELFLVTFDLTHAILLWSFPLPFLLLESDQMGVWKRIGLGVVFALGLGAVLCSGTRLYSYLMSGGMTFAMAIGSPYAITATVADSLEISLAIIAISLVTLGPLCEVLTERLARLRSNPGVLSEPRRRSGSIANSRPTSLYRRQARAQGAQSGESVLLDNYPRPGQRPTTATSAQTGGSSSQVPRGSPLDMPMPRLSRPHPAFLRGSSRSGSAPGPSSLLARRLSAAGGLSAAAASASASASTSAEDRYSGPGVLVTTTVDVVRSSFVNVRIDSDDDATPAFPGITTTSTAGKPHDD